MGIRVLGIVFVAVVLSAPARALEPVMDADTSADSSAAPQYVGAALARWHLHFFGDARLRHEHTQDIPGRTEDLTRGRATFRSGFEWTPVPRFGAEFSLRGAGGSRQDHEFPRIDNDQAHLVEVDRFNVSMSPWSDATLRAGRMAMPLRLSELLWDADLRPWGVALTQRQGVGTLDVVRAGVGVWRRDELVDDAVVGVAQAGWAFREGAEISGEAVVSWLWFENTNELIRGDLARQNRVRVPSPIDPVATFANPFRLLDLQLEGKFVVASLPVCAAVDLVRNVEASTNRNAVRTKFVAGRFGERFGAEAGWSYLRAEQEALLGAFASDDWWSRTRFRGQMAWTTLGWSDWLRLRVFGTFEWRDGVGERTERVVSELTLRWRAR